MSAFKTLLAGLSLLAMTFTLLAVSATPSDAQRVQVWTGPFFQQCFTDDGYGRMLPCDYSGGSN